MYKKNKVFMTVVTLMFLLVLYGCHSDKGNTTNQTTTTTGETTTTTVSTELNTTYTDNLKLTQDYTGKDFITDGIGVVTLSQCIDGDTAVFNDNGTIFHVRFLGIDTPESTAKLDPWGKAASHYTCDKLTNAKTIVLQREGQIFDSTGSRYLAWVWYDGRLLNLELVEEAYTGTKGLTGSAYEQTFFSAELKTQKTGRRIWGEKDPNYNYSDEATQVTLKELRENQNKYLGQKVMITGVITRVYATDKYCAFIEQDGYGAYIFTGYLPVLTLRNGYKVNIIANVSQYNGMLELSNLDKNNIVVVSKDNVSTPNVITVDQISENLESTLVQINNLTVKDLSSSSDGSYSVYADDPNGKEVEIRIDSNLYPKVDKSLFPVGKKFDIVGNISEYTYTGEPQSYQITLSNLSDITFE